MIYCASTNYYYYYYYYYYFFKVNFYISFYKYKKPINVNLPRKLLATQTQNGLQIYLFNKSANHFVSKSASTC